MSGRAPIEPHDEAAIVGAVYHEPTEYSSRVSEPKSRAVQRSEHDLPGEFIAVRNIKNWVYDRLKRTAPTVSEMDWIEAALHQAYRAGYAYAREEGE